MKITKGMLDNLVERINMRMKYGYGLEIDYEYGQAVVNYTKNGVVLLTITEGTRSEVYYELRTALKLHEFLN